MTVLPPPTARSQPASAQKAALAQVSSKTLRELAYEELRRALIAGHFAPGEAITIAQVARQLQIGVMPAREAIQQLATQGAFEFLANRSVRVPNIDFAELTDLFEARLLVESDLVRRAASRKNERLGVSLTHKAASLEQALAARALPAILSANYEFHFSVYGAAAAATLNGIAERLWLRMSPLHISVFRAHADRTTAFLETLPSHHALIAAIAKGDAATSVKIFRGMLEHSRDWHVENMARHGVTA
jgi:DNA-binding GntR family transcriptional regulator